MATTTVTVNVAESQNYLATSRFIDVNIKIPTKNTWIPKTWKGLTQFNGYTIWTDGDNIYRSYNYDQYVLDKSTSTWSSKTWNGLTSFNATDIWTDGDNIYCADVNNHYILTY